MDADAAKSAVSQLIKESNAQKKIARGFNESRRELEKHTAALVILAENIDDKQYVDVIKALAGEAQCPLIEKYSREELGQWAGLCKIDQNTGEPTKIVRTSSIILKSWPRDSEAVAAVKAMIQQ